MDGVGEDEVPDRDGGLLVVGQTMRETFGSGDGVQQLLVGQS